MNDDLGTVPITYPPKGDYRTYREGETFSTVRFSTVRHYRVLAGVPICEKVEHTSAASSCDTGKRTHLGPCPGDAAELSRRSL